MSDSELREVQAIVSELQTEIRRHLTTLQEHRLPPLPDPLANVRAHQKVNSHLPIGWPVMPKGLMPKLAAYAQKITRRLLRWYINPLVEQQNTFNADVAAALQRLDAMITALTTEVSSSLADARRRSEQAEDKVRELEGRLLSVDQALWGAQQEAVRRQEQLAEEVKYQHAQQGSANLRLQRLENWQRSDNPPAQAQPVARRPKAAASGLAPDVDYFLLGAQYRNEEQIGEWLDDYKDLFGALQEGQAEGRGPSGPILDIGCGRGQLVARLTELGLSAYGIDVDVDAIQFGQAAGRNVQQADAFAHLTHLADDSLAGVVMIQVAEHFEVRDLLRLLALITRKLAPAGFILVETVNPTCLYAFSNWYLMDPSHRTPLHPQVTRFLMEQAGYHGVEIRFLHPVPDRERLQLLSQGDREPALDVLIQHLDQNVELLNRFLYGPQDYAAIGYKPQEP